MCDFSHYWEVFLSEIFVNKQENKYTGASKDLVCRQVRVPVSILMVLMVLYLLFGAEIFSCWEGWSYIGACYFSFITLTTIGFGDLVPGNRSVGAAFIFWNTKSVINLGRSILF